MSEATREGMAKAGRLCTPYELQHVHGSTDLCCVLDSCKSTVRDFDALMEHIYQHGKLAGNCALCPADNRQDHSRNIHFLGLTATKMTMDHLLRHLPPRLECQICHALYATTSNLSTHMEIHTGKALEKKDIDCPYCGWKFYSPRDLNVHIADKHDVLGGQVRSLTCKHGCGMSFVNGDTRNSHEDLRCEYRPYDNVRMHACPEENCGLEFPDRGQLSDHQHTVHVRAPEVGVMLSRIGVSAPWITGSTVVRSGIEGADEHRETDRRGVGGLMGAYDRGMI
jgi:hypothetical protein